VVLAVLLIRNLINLTDTNTLLSSFQSSPHLAMPVPALPRLSKLPGRPHGVQTLVLQPQWQSAKWKTGTEYLTCIDFFITDKRSWETDFFKFTGQRVVSPLKKTQSYYTPRKKTTNQKLARQQYCSSRTYDRYIRWEARENQYLNPRIHEHFGEKGFFC